MANQARTMVEKQIGRVRRRLFFQIALQSIALCLAAGLLLSTFWFLLRPFAFVGLGETVRWSVPGVLLGLGMCAGMVLAWLRRPSRVLSSLALDERFALKERVTTLLTLPDGVRETPAGQALLHDVTERLGNLHVASAFPLHLSLKQMLMPAAAFLLALLACVFDPILADLKFRSTTLADQPRQVADAKEIQQQLDNLKKIVNERNQEPQLKSEELKEMEKEFEKLLNQPLDGKNEQKVRERIDEMRKLEDKMKDRLDGLKGKTEKIDALKKQLEKLGLDKDKLLKDGPAKDFEDALMKGNLDKAKAELQKIVQDLKNEKLNPKQQKELAEQFKKLQDKLQKLMDNDEFKKKLKQDLKDGKITKDDLAREMENFKHLQDLTDILGEAQDNLEKGAGKDGGEKLDKLLKRFEEIELTEAEIRDLLRDQDEIADALELLQGMEGDGEGDGMGEGRRPGGRRRADPNDPNGKISPERSRAQVDSKGVQRVSGYARGGTFNKIPAKAVEGAFRQAVQEAPEALDRQRIPEDAEDIARGYFNKLGNQK